MIQRILNSKNLVAFVLAAATGMTLYFRVPFPEGNIFLRVMALRSPSAFEVLRYSYTLFLFSTPYIGCSVVLSGLYIFALRAKQRIRAGKLSFFPDSRKRDDLFLVVGEVHNPRKQLPAESPQWLVIPERGLFTGVAILGAIGSGKTSCCMYPFAEQILAYRATDVEKGIGGLVLEVRGDFCHRVKEILARHGRAEDYIEISLDSKYRYNPLQSDLDACALVHNIASLLNNLFGRGKEPFWQQAYTNLVKFIILLHKVAFDYAKRCLARGGDPAEIMRRIADYRAEDKHEPAYYARHTVEKAQTEMESRLGTRNGAGGQKVQEIDSGRDEIELQ